MRRRDPVATENQRECGKEVVGARGFEPPTPRSRTECSTRLSHAPTQNVIVTPLAISARRDAARPCPGLAQASPPACRRPGGARRPRFSAMPWNACPFDAVLLISFGGPLRRADIRPIPAERAPGTTHTAGPRRGGGATLRVVRRRVAAHRDLTRRQAEGLRARLAATGPKLPVFVGMRNWHPFSRRHPGGDGGGGGDRTGARHRPGCAPQLLELRGSTCQNVAQARQELRARAAADVEVLFAPGWHTHRGFVEANARRIDAGPTPASRRRAAGRPHRLHRTQHPDGDGGGVSLRDGPAGDGRTRGRPRGDRRLGVGVPERGVDGPRTPGWSRTSASICAPRMAAACGRRSSLRSGSWPITSRCCTTSTRKRPRSAATSACRCAAQRRSTTHPAFVDTLADVTQRACEQARCRRPLPIVPASPPARLEPPPPAR